MGIYNTIAWQVKNQLLSRSRAALITGTGRCGTSFLANSLGELHPELHVEHEVEPTGIGIQNLSPQDQRRVIIDARGRFGKKGIFDKKHRPVLIESNCFLAMGSEAYMDVWQLCHVIGIIRAWDTCIESMASQTYSTHPSFFYADHDHQRSRRPNPSQLGLMSESEWSKHSRIEKTAWYWSYINNHLMDLEEKYPARVRLVSFEQLLADQDEVLNDIQAFLEIPIRKLKREVATNSSEELNQRRVSLKEYSAEEIESIKRITEATQTRVTAYFSDKP
ncbi:MAG: hypothetical protein CBB70_00335 [Planctomycetaceae bacterium TMED10]|nr:MAG: hypothetical protein CBB70_00335 [Planctomycetaceae bacterium TMED10]